MNKTIPELPYKPILHVYRGSISHGTYIPEHIDDIDTMAIVVPPKDHYLGLKQFGSKGTQEIKKNEWDIVIYEAKKAISLLSKMNPNVLCLLWVDQKDIIELTPAGQLLRMHRTVFSNRNHAYNAFCGYAHSQLKKMTRGKYEGYMGAKRKALVDKFGYDPKNASHLIRLLRMGTEFLLTGELLVDRTNIDADELLDIKLGKWSLKKILARATTNFQTLEDARECSVLPETTCFKVINQLCVDVIETAWKENK